MGWFYFEKQQSCSHRSGLVLQSIQEIREILLVYWLRRNLTKNAGDSRMDSIEAERNELFQILEKVSPFPAILHRDGEVMYFNELLRHEVGTEEANYVYKKHPELFDLEDGKAHKFSMVVHGGETKWYELQSKEINVDGSSAILSYFIDITEKQQNETQLSRIASHQGLMLEVTQTVFQLEHLQDIYEVILDSSFQALNKATLGSVLILDGDDLIVAAFRGFSDSIKEFVLPLDESFLYQETKGALDRIVYIQNLEGYAGYRPIKTSHGDEKLIKSTITTPIHVEGNFFGMINIDSVEQDAFDEIDKNTMEFLKFNIESALTNHFLYLEKASLAKHDPLTKLYNRRYFEEFFDNTIERAERYGEEFCIVLIDIDGLKKINDLCGHLVGDQAIQQVGTLISEDTRKSDLLARIGGDEFVGIYLGTTKEQINTKFDLIHQKKIILKTNDACEDSECSFSFGVASYPADGRSPDELVRKADLRMYKMKKSHQRGIDETGN
jgi:diguanylate cyclase (GGDEF)-like protein